MASVQIVLKENVPNVGSIGDVVRVRRGYARNFLLPRGLAVMATRSTMAQVEHEKAVQTARANKLRGEQQKIIDAIEKPTFVIAKQATEEGKLYGALSAADVAEVLQERGFQIDREQIKLPAASIKEIGSHTLTIQFPYKMSAQIKIELKTKA